MITTEKADELIEELEKEMVNSQRTDQFGYYKQDAWDVYKKVIKRLKEINYKGDK